MLENLVFTKLLYIYVRCRFESIELKRHNTETMIEKGVERISLSR